MGRVKVVCGAMVFKGDDFVLVKEAQPKAYGKWCYPGGQLEAGEDIMTTAVREVREETGLDVKLDGLIGVYEHRDARDGSNLIKFVFRASVIGGELKYREGELLDAKWFSFEEFANLKDGELRGAEVRKTVEDSRDREMIPLDAINLAFGSQDRSSAITT